MTKVSALPTITVTATDYLYLVDDTTGTPTSGRATVSELGDALIAQKNLLTDTSGVGLGVKSSPATTDLFLLFDAANSDAPVTATGGQVVDGLTLVTSSVTGVSGADRITNMISLTQAEYDAIGTKDATTLYVIVE